MFMIEKWHILGIEVKLWKGVTANVKQDINSTNNEITAFENGSEKKQIEKDSIRMGLKWEITNICDFDGWATKMSPPTDSQSSETKSKMDSK